MVVVGVVVVAMLLEVVCAERRLVVAVAVVSQLGGFCIRIYIPLTAYPKCNDNHLA
jgi:hypothetical protein